MLPTLRRKLELLAERRDELERLLADPSVIGDQNAFRKLSREFARLEPVAQAMNEDRQAREDLAAAIELRADPELAAMAEEEIAAAEARIAELDTVLMGHLVPRDARDDGSLYLEVRAGTGGDEAAIFAGDLFRMYMKYIEKQPGWKTSIISSNAPELGGFKEVVFSVEGSGVYGKLKYESGVHRVQRVPVTEAGGRIHTSTATVAVLPEAEDVEIDLNMDDVRVDYFRASGAGGQHVNKTSSAVRMTHIPTGMVVECQDERSQLENRAKALRVLKARLLDQAQQKADAELTEERRSQVGTGDRSERIRTYNFPQGRVTDHRINLTLYKLDNILNGDIDEFIQALAEARRAELMKEAEDE